MTLIQLVKRYQAETRVNIREGLLDQILDEIAPSLYVFLKSNAPTAPNDLRTTVLLEIVENLDDFMGGTDKEFWSWCNTITRRRIAKHFKGNYGERVIPVPTEELLRLADIEAFKKSTEEDERVTEVREAISSLSESDPNCYEILWNRFVLGFNFPEIAATKRIKVDTARQRANRCLDELKPILGGGK